MAGSTVTFVVRLIRDEAGHTIGIVEQVKTGRKERVERLETIGLVIAEMFAGTSTEEAQNKLDTGGSP